MNRSYCIVAFALVSVVLFVGMLFFVSALSDTMTVEANILSGVGNTTGNSSIIRVEVPDYLFFGNVTNGKTSSELKVYVNNTGNVDIAVTPRLIDSSEEIFSYLYFRDRKTRTVNGSSTDVNFTRIGDFSFNITKPSSGDSFNDEYFYVMLDLRGYGKDVNEDILGHRSNVKFVAVQK